MKYQKGFSKPTVVLITIFILILIGVGYFAYKQFSFSKNQLSQNQSQNIQQNNSNQVAAWKTYVNNHYGFTVNYPNYPEIDTTRQNVDLLFYGQAVQLLHEEFSFGDKGLSKFITIYHIPLPFDQFKQKTIDYSNHFGYKIPDFYPIKVDTNPAYEFESFGGGAGGLCVTKEYLIDTSDGGINIIFGKCIDTTKTPIAGEPSFSELDINQFNQMISTFKFMTEANAPTLEFYCKPYTGFSDVISYLKSKNVGVPVLLPMQLPESYTTLPASTGKLYVSYFVDDIGEYGVNMSLGFNIKDYDCRSANSNEMGSFNASKEIPLYFSQGEKIDLANGIQGYYFESGRGDTNINWMYSGVYHQATGLHMTKAEAIATVNSAINNQQ